jgi:hypothetical protein
MTDPELAVMLLQRMDDHAEALANHARDDILMMERVSRQIEDKSTLDRAERAVMSSKMDSLNELMTVFNGFKGMKALLLTGGALAAALTAIGAAIWTLLHWIRS